MKVRFGTILLHLNGKPLQVGDPPKDMTLGTAAVEALLALYPDEKDTSGEEKLRRFTLSAVAFNETDAELKIEEVALIKKLLAKAYGPLVVGRAYAAIEDTESSK